MIHSICFSFQVPKVICLLLIFLFSPPLLSLEVCCDNNIENLSSQEKIWYNRRAMRYTSDMTDSQWEIIKPILQEAKYRSLEEKREQINAVFYLVKTGCQWRNLPKDFPKWKTVYSFYRRACLNGIWDKIQKALVKKVRLAKGKKETPSYALIDSQSAKTVSSNEKRGYDGGKKRNEEKDT